ncbi:MAG: hypothetical protein ACI30O_07970 [Muribaculaceae bacterium]
MNKVITFLTLCLVAIGVTAQDKGGEKLAESEEDLLEHRTDGTDAFDTLYIGCEKFPITATLSPSPCRAYRKKSRYVYIYVKLFRNFALSL